MKLEDRTWNLGLRMKTGEHGKVIAEVQHKESIMFLAEILANHWCCFNFFRPKTPSACHITAAAAYFRPTGQALSGPEGQYFLLLDDRHLALIRWQEIFCHPSCRPPGQVGAAT